MADKFRLQAKADPRFAKFQTDPKFRLPSSKYAKVAIDSRFSRMLKDEDFTRKAKVDRYGRKVSSRAGEAHLKKLYKLETSPTKPDQLDKEPESEDEDEEIVAELAKANDSYDPARDGGFSHSSSDDDSDDEESTDEDLEEVDDEVRAEDADPDIPMGDITRRLGIVNLDWDNIRAIDLMAVFQSFMPPSGKIEEVVVYPSEFGRERMEREETEGPPKEIFRSSAVKQQSEEELNGESDSSEDPTADETLKNSLLAEDKGEDFDPSSLRRYQLDRLRYYYAVMTLSSPATAKAIYDSCDGAEFQSSANFFDLRFVPDDVDFLTEKPRDRCDNLPVGYRPTEFVTDVLQHSKLKLSWDAEDAARKDAVKKAFSREEAEEQDLKDYLASSTEESDQELVAIPAPSKSKDDAPVKVSKKEAERQRVRGLLGLSEQKLSKKSGPVGDMQITFSAGINGDEMLEDGETAKSNGQGVFANEPELTTMEKYIKKERERKAKRKEKYREERNINKAELGDMLKERQRKTALLRNGFAVEAEEKTDAFDEFEDDFFKDASAAKKKREKQDRKSKKHRKGADQPPTEAENQERANLEMLMMDDELKPLRRSGGKGGKGEVNEVDVNDSRFQAVFDRPEFAIDPSHPRFDKKAPGMKRLLEEGRERRKKKRRLERE